MTLNEYIQSINARLAEGHTSEHTFRGDLEQLLRTQLPTYHITNEPSQITDCGNPDFLVTQGKIPIGYIEAKEIGKDLNAKLYKEQFTRYRKALDNLIITDYIWFQFYEHGELVTEIRLGEYDIDSQKIIADDKQFINSAISFKTLPPRKCKASSHQLSSQNLWRARRACLKIF